MKNIIYLSTLLLAIFYTLSMLQPHAGSADSRSAEGSSNWQEFKQATNQKLEKLDAKIHQLGNRIDNGNKEAKTEFNNILNDAKSTKKAIADKFDEMGEDTQQSWRSAKTQIDAAMNKLEASYERLKADLTD